MVSGPAKWWVAQPSARVAQPGVGVAQPGVGVAQPALKAAQQGMGFAQVLALAIRWMAHEILVTCPESQNGLSHFGFDSFKGSTQKKSPPPISEHP